MSSQEVIPQFPPPPAFYKRFKKEDGEAPPPPPPPPVPESGQYLLFGETRSLEEKTQTLEAEGLRTLFDAAAGAPKEELAKLVHGSKLKFRAILLALADNAEQDQVDDTLRDFHLQLVNMMYLVNETREVEAKDEVIGMLERQIEAKQRVIAGLRAKLARCETEVAQAAQALFVVQRGDDGKGEQEAKTAASSSSSLDDLIARCM